MRVRVVLSLILVVVCVVGLGAWWMGPKLAHMAFIDGQRGEPYGFIDLARYPAQDRFVARYDAPVVELLGSEGGQFDAPYELAHLVQGRVADEWQRMTRWRMERASDLVQALTSAPYRLAHDQTPELQTLKLGSYELGEPQWRDVVVVWLAAVRSEGGYPFVGVLEELSQSEGRVVWRAPVASVTQDTRWQEILVIDFASEKEALGWLRSESMRMQRDVTNADLADLMIAIYTRDFGQAL